MQTRIAGEPLPSALTTPEAPDLQALFAVMLAGRCGRGGDGGLLSRAVLGRVGGTRFAVGAFTNLSQDHLDFHHDMESYFQAKSCCSTGAPPAEVIDIDDEYGVRLAGLRPDATTVSGLGERDRGRRVGPPPDWSGAGRRGAARRRSADHGGRPAGAVVSVDIALPGRVQRGQRGHRAGLPVDAAGRGRPAAAADGLAGAVVPGRLERVDAGQDFMAVVDYAHKPAALAAVLDAVREMSAGG